MGFSGGENSEVDPPPSLDSCRKRKRHHALPVAETLELWRENSEAKEARKAPAKGSKKGCTKGKGGPQNQSCKYRGVRQRTWGKWVAEIQAPNGGKRLWLGTVPAALGAVTAYDEVARAMYGEKAILNMPNVSDSDSVAVTAAAAVSDSMTCASSNSEICDKNVDAEGETTGMATAVASVSDCMTCASSNSEICYRNVGVRVETTGMNVQFGVDSEAPWTRGGMNLTVNGTLDVCDKRAEAEENDEAKPGDYLCLDELEIFYDISMEFAENIDYASFSDESDSGFFNVTEFLDCLG